MRSTPEKQIPSPKLYKFRSLLDCNSFERVAEILETGKFWCSPLWEQNDPMEGVYVDLREAAECADLPDLFNEKNRRQICSFSGEKALRDPLMWGYYAGGFKGVAIEIEDTEEAILVDYVDETPRIQSEKDPITNVLTRKLKAWKREEEYRYLVKDSIGLRKLGKIAAVYFGNPYGSVSNQSQIVQASRTIQEYMKRIERLQEIAEKMKYDIYFAQLTPGGSVLLQAEAKSVIATESTGFE